MDCQIINLEDWKRSKEEEKRELEEQNIAELKEELSRLVEKIEIPDPIMYVPVFSPEQENDLSPFYRPYYSGYDVGPYNSNYDRSCPCCGYDFLCPLGKEED